MPEGSVDEIIEYISEYMPFSNEIILWLRENSNVLEALKLMAVVRFVHFSGINVIEPNDTRKDRILGIVVYDTKAKILKQDFLVDQEDKHRDFVYYTVLPQEKSSLYSKRVSHINNFQDKYGKNGDFEGTHHPELSSLHPELQERIVRYLSLTGQTIL